MIVHLGHSPDSDDAFMFYPLATGQLDTGDIEFVHVLQDIETLNQWAREGRLEVTALSAHAYPHVQHRYALLRHGASMGVGYGPLVVARDRHPAAWLRGRRIAVPGFLTTAYLALRLKEPDFEPVVLPFDRIMAAVARGEVDAGLIIHEGQLTHPEHGLAPVLDLGRWWQEETGLPLPLGLNAIRRDLSPETAHRISALLRQSIAYALSHREAALQHALQYARGMAHDTADRFVGMYVNDLTVDMGEEGMRAVRLLLERGAAQGLVPPVERWDFVA